MKNKLEEILSVLNTNNEVNLSIFLYQTRRNKNPERYKIYKMLIDAQIKNVMINVVKSEIKNFIELIEDNDNKVLGYNPDLEQDIFMIKKSEIYFLKKIWPYLVEEEEPEILEIEHFSNKNINRAWIVSVEYIRYGKEERIFLLQKFVKSQHLTDKKIAVVYINNEYKLISDKIVEIGRNFETIILEDYIISKKLRDFEYIFEFEIFYKEKAGEFINEISNFDKIQIIDEVKEKILEKIKTNKKFAHKLYSAYRNGYYEYIDINKLKDLQKRLSLRINIKNEKIIIDDQTNLEDLLRVLNDDFEKSLLTENEYVVHKKEKLK
ncbi:MAG: DUF4868 domain-containing protein [Thermosipho sp. (in: Bacteria)]|nr:DUF4868 domain-containing protein [Thermosipho sp. (in: thermotogales)]